jgi:hypothetical protein
LRFYLYFISGILIISVSFCLLFLFYYSPMVCFVLFPVCGFCSFIIAVVARLVRHFSLLVLVALSLRFFLVVGLVVPLFVFLLVVFPIGEGPSFLVVPLSSFALLPAKRSW